jgi:hypothetical protein
MFPSAYLLIVLAQPAAAPLDEMEIVRKEAGLELGWSDAEDRIQGTISPRVPVEGAAIEVSAHVGTFQGPVFDGPVTFSLKPADTFGGAEEHTVTRAADGHGWQARFNPVPAGDYRLEISFRTTRLKVARASLNVAIAKLPRWPAWVMVGAAAVAVLALGVRAVSKNQEQT